MIDSDTATNRSSTHAATGPCGGHFSASKCPECDQKKSSRLGWRKRRGWQVCAECVEVIDARKAALNRMAENAQELGLSYE